MTTMEDFVNAVRIIAAKGGSEAAQKLQVSKLPTRYVANAEYCKTGAVQKLVGNLRVELRKQADRASPGRTGALLESAHDEVTSWLRQNAQ
jgi:hypothetical protein